MWLSPSGQVAHTTLDWRLCRTRIFTLIKANELSAEDIQDLRDYLDELDLMEH